MYTVEDAYRPASNLYWIAFLLTARAELSLDVTLEVLGSEDGLELLSSPRTLPHVRKRVIAMAVAAIKEEVTASAQRIALKAPDRIVMPLPKWPISPCISQAQIEKAVLAIEVFPRCALLLTIFEGFPVDDAAELLHSGREEVCRAQEVGLWELTCNLRSFAATHSTWLKYVGETASLR